MPNSRINQGYGGNQGNSGNGSNNQNERGSEKDNWVWLKEEIKSLQTKTTELDKKIENLSRHLEDRLDKNSIKIQDNEKVMYEMNNAMEKKLYES